MPKKFQIKLKPKGKQKQTHKITISVDFNTENVYALQTLRINQGRP